MDAKERDFSPEGLPDLKPTFILVGWVIGWLAIMEGGSHSALEPLHGHNYNLSLFFDPPKYNGHNSYKSHNLLPGIMRAWMCHVKRRYGEEPHRRPKAHIFVCYWRREGLFVTYITCWCRTRRVVRTCRCQVQGLG
jgi:hypothetical protein